jgi:hypothetical protein
MTHFQAWATILPFRRFCIRFLRHADAPLDSSASGGKKGIAAKAPGLVPNLGRGEVWPNGSSSLGTRPPDLCAAYDGHLRSRPLQKHSGEAGVRSGESARVAGGSSDRRQIIWTGEPQRDGHQRSADFLDAEHYPEITFSGNKVEVEGDRDCLLTGQLTIRGATREASLKVRWQGQWKTPWWEDSVDKGPKARAGFVAKTKINRRDFGVSWNAALNKGSVVVGDTVDITIDAEAILEKA